mmetsp:Transcript_34741/g.85054  ORF Transcript_34741/g.85054 Transcript_34741/m.85054 type:complete len:433 (-) Transcript_34741:205-1503(-)
MAILRLITAPSNSGVSLMICVLPVSSSTTSSTSRARSSVSRLDSGDPELPTSEGSLLSSSASRSSSSAYCNLRLTSESSPDAGASTAGVVSATTRARALASFDTSSDASPGPPSAAYTHCSSWPSVSGAKAVTPQCDACLNSIASEPAATGTPPLPYTPVRLTTHWPGLSATITVAVPLPRASLLITTSPPWKLDTASVHWNAVERARNTQVPVKPTPRSTRTRARKLPRASSAAPTSPLGAACTLYTALWVFLLPHGPAPHPSAPYRPPKHSTSATRLKLPWDPYWSSHQHPPSFMARKGRARFWQRRAHSRRASKPAPSDTSGRGPTNISRSGFAVDVSKHPAYSTRGGVAAGFSGAADTVRYPPALECTSGRRYTDDTEPSLAPPQGPTRQSAPHWSSPRLALNAQGVFENFANRKPHVQWVSLSAMCG